MKIWLNQLLCHHLWDKRCHWYRGDSTVYKKCRLLEVWESCLYRL
ncbi:hypothetical protein [Turicibacter sanguinis]|nr:hypothetical protein [Turicibacter sanguinis]